MDKELKHAIRVYVQEYGYSYRQVARMFGVSHTTVRRVIVGQSKLLEQYRKKYESLPEEVKRYIRLTTAGVFKNKAQAYREISHILGKHGIKSMQSFYELLRSVEEREDFKGSETELIKFLRGLGISQRGIGRLLGISKTTVRRKLNQELSE